MRRIFPIALLVTLSMAACQDRPSPTSPPGESSPTASPAISDGANDADGNPHFFWLPPMVEQPDESLLETFDPTQRPTIWIVCFTTTDSDAEPCDPTNPIAEFTVGQGIVIEDDHYKVEFDTGAFGLEPSDEDGSTTYRILALTPPLPDDLFLGLDVSRGTDLGSYVFGLADFQLGANGGAAQSLSTGESIGLIDGRTLPIRFRLDEGALEEEIRINSAEATTDPDQALCQINCSITVIEPDEPTEAFLEDPDNPGFDITSILFEAGDVDETSVLVIDERATENGNCAPGIGLDKEACFRYEISPDEPFNNPVDMGICPIDVPSDDAWRILKFDEDRDPSLTRPTQVFVPFLDCDPNLVGSQPTALWDGVGGELAASTLRWLVAPLWARDRWGASINDLSDLFWGQDADLRTVTNPDATVLAGETVDVTMEVVAPHDGDAHLAGVPVTFEVTGGGGILGGQQTSVTVATDANTGEASVDWTVGLGANTLEVTSSDAESDPDPIVFEVTGVTGSQRIAFTSDRSGTSDDLWVVQVSSAGDTVDGTFQRVTTSSAFDNGAAWSPDGSHLAFHSDRNGTLEVFALEVDATGAPVAGSLVQVTSGGFDRFPSWSPNGELIAFDSDRSGNSDIWVVKVDPSTGTPVANSLVPVTQHIDGDDIPVWSPDGSHIAFNSRRDGSNADIWVVEVDPATGQPVATSPVQVTTDATDDRFLAWSPDGDRIAFSGGDQNGNFDIWVVDVAPSGDPTGIPTRVTRDPAFDGSPAWSPDGSHITFQRGPQGSRDVWSVEVDASGNAVQGTLKRVTTDPGDDLDPAWSVIPAPPPVQ